MRIVRHSKYVAQRKRRAKLMAGLGFLVLISTLFMATMPNFLAVSYFAMIAGFVVFNFGMQQVGKWTRNPRNDQLLDFQLKGLSDKFTLVHFAPFGQKRVEHVLIHQGGLLVLTARELDGEIDQHAGKWRRRNVGLRRFFQFSGPQLGNPSTETGSSIGAIEKYLEENRLELDVEGAVVFIHPNAELNIEEPDFPVLHGDEVPQYVQTLEVDPTFSGLERDQLIALLSEGQQVEAPSSQTRRRPVKRRAA